MCAEASSSAPEGDGASKRPADYECVQNVYAGDAKRLKMEPPPPPPPRGGLKMEPPTFAPETPLLKATSRPHPSCQLG